MAIEVVKSFAPSREFPRFSEGAFERMEDGTIVFIFSRFMESSDDSAPSDLVRTESKDGGKTWSEPEVIIRAKEDYNTGNIMSVSLMTMNNGDLGCFYIVKQTNTINRIILSRSKDGGKTFYSHTECTLEDREAYYVLNNDRCERLASGRLVLPLAFHRGGYQGGNAKRYFDCRGVACFLLSDDDGYTWHESVDLVYPPFTHSPMGFQETGAVELRPGVLMGYVRTDMCYQYEFFSFDEGEHWTTAQPSRFTSPCSPMKIKRNPYSGDLVAIWNPIPNYNGRDTGSIWGRTPLVYAVSKDNGKTWSKQTVIEGKEDCGYCYPSIFFLDEKTLLTSYCAGGPGDGSMLSRTNITKIEL